jgi:hypothetical protein
MTDHEKRVEELVNLLGCSIFEAEQIIADDKKIDKGQEVDFGLTKEQEKQALKYANVKEHKKPAVYKFDKRERKADTDKGFLIGLIKDTLNECGEIANLTIVNQERELTFELNDRKFKIVLSAPRS